MTDANGSARERFHLLDAAGLVAGYGLASLLMRAYWPENQSLSVWESLVIGFVFVWLGLAMSGPVVLLFRRPVSTDPDDDLPPPRTRPELAWMVIGFYWIGLTLLAVPVRLRGGRVLDSAILGVFPFLAAIGLQLGSGRRYRSRAGATDSWTHRAGWALLISWPFAWLGLILLGKTLL